MVHGAYGLFTTFYLSGAYSVPRRYTFYPSDLGFASIWAAAGAGSALTFLAGFAVYLMETGKRWLRIVRTGT